MKPKIREDYKSAIKDKNATAKLALSLLISVIDSEEKGLKRDLTDEEITKVISKEIKKRNQSIDAFNKANRLDLVTKEEEEIKILEVYLPKALTYYELVELAKEISKDNPEIHPGKLFGMVNKASNGLSNPEDIKKAITEV